MLYVLWILDFLTAVCCFPSNLISVCQCSSQLSMNIWGFQNQGLFQKQWLRIGEDLTGVSLQWELFLYQWSMGKNNQYLSAKCNINIIWNRFRYPGDQKSATPPSNLSAPKRGTGAVTTSSLPSWPMSLAAARLSMKSLSCILLKQQIIEHLHRLHCKQARMRELSSLWSHCQDIPN